MINYHEQKQLEKGKGLFSLTLPEGKSGKELNSGTERDLGGTTAHWFAPHG